MTALELMRELDDLIRIHGDREVAVVLEPTTGLWERLPFKIRPAIRSEGLASRSAQVYFALVPAVTPQPAVTA